MSCTEFDLRLSDGIDTPEHRESCDRCKELFNSIMSLEDALTIHYTATFAPPLATFASPRASAVADLLDLIGWAGIALIAAFSLWLWLPPDIGFTGPVLFSAAGVLVTVAFTVTVWVSTYKAA